MVVALRVPAISSHLLMGLAEDAELILHMVTHLMGDDVGVSEVAIGTNLLFHAFEKFKVEINCFVGRAIERSAGRGGVTTTRTNSIAEDNHLGRIVGAPHFLEFFVPHVFGACKDAFAERHQFYIDLAVVGAIVDILRCGAWLLHLFHDSAGVAAHKYDNQGDNNTANT